MHGPYLRETYFSKLDVSVLATGFAVEAVT